MIRELANKFFEWINEDEGQRLRRHNKKCPNCGGTWKCIAWNRCYDEWKCETCGYEDGIYDLGPQ